MDGSKRGFLRGVVALCTGLCMLVLAVPAFANAPNPGATTVDQVTINPNGSRTVTVEGTWTWASQTKCPTARNGVGYQVDWFDNQTNSIGTSSSPNGILFVGDSQDNIVHSIETLGGDSTVGNAFFNGVPSSYLSHNTTDTTPNSTDAKNWLSQCNGLNASGVTAGSWGPISHTYASGFTQQIQLCPIMYDPHGGHDNSGQSSVQDITAGSNSADGGKYNSDNSYQTNGTGPNGNICPKVTIPTLTTSASSGTIGQAGGFHDSATLTGSSGSGTINWSVFPVGSNCQGAPLFTDSLDVNGDGTFSNPNGFNPTATGTYQWQAEYSSSTIKDLLTNCSDSAEQTTVGPAGPTISTAVPSSTAAVGDTIEDTATLAGATNPTGTITWKLYSNASCTPASLVDTVTANVDHGNGTYTTNPGFTTSTAGTYHWIASYSGDSNNSPATGSCSDPNEQTAVSSNPPEIALVKLEKIGSSAFTHGPIHGPVGATVDYQMTVTNDGQTPLVIDFTDLQCDTGTLSGPVVKAGTYDSVTRSLSIGGVLQYTCSHVLHKGDQPYTNKADVTGTPPNNGPQVHAHDQVDAFADTSAIRVVKLERDASTGGPFTVGPITVTEEAGNYVVHTIQYEILVTNTGNTPLKLSLDDPMCDAHTVRGPTQVSGTLSGDVLSPGGEAQYTCSHNLVKGDPSPFTNTATVTGTPPVGPPVSGTSHVTVNKRTVARKRICRTPSGRVIHYTGNRKPRACRFHPKKPKKPNGFTG